MRNPTPTGTGLGRSVVLAGLAVALAVLAGCGGSGSTPGSSPSSTTTPEVSVTSSTSPGVPIPSSGPPIVTATASPGALATIRGTVTEGVESGCIVLVDDAGAAVANLQGWDLEAHPFDSRVEVTGVFETDLMTTCQQGTPFEVRSVVGL